MKSSVPTRLLQKFHPPLGTPTKPQWRRCKVSFRCFEVPSNNSSSVFDASTKFPNGLVVGNFFDLGNFDECLAIKYENLYGKYCLGTLPLSSLNITSAAILADKFSIPRQPFAMHPQPRLVSLGEDYTGFHFAACVPSNWSAADIPGSLIYTEDFCYSKATERELSAGAIATIVILAVILAIMVASTLFDIFLFYTNRASPHELLVSFSVLSNGRKIFQASKNPDQLLCLNGIKAISMMWVIIGHEYSLVINSAVSNLPDAKEWENEAVNMFIVGATVSVDTFFVVGGLVTVYTYLKSMAKGVKFNVLLFYLHRYLRLTPALAIMALIHLYLINHFGDGPLWKVVDFTLVQTCQRGWWSTFLYITNYVKHDQCLPQTWYLSVDMQLFVLAPIVLIPLSRWPKIGLGLLGVLTVAGVIAPFSIGYAKNLGNMLSDPNYMSEYYTQTYARFGPYVIGMILGYFLYKIKQAEMRLRLPPVQHLLLFLVRCNVRVFRLLFVRCGWCV
jgi:peptidoglycan/LPS O-acetylase OafA/YrhL